MEDFTEITLSSQGESSPSNSQTTIKVEKQSFFRQIWVEFRIRLCPCTYSNPIIIKGSK
jgi:hypothetical protein